MCSQGFLPTLETAFQSLVGALIFSGPCTRCALSISTLSYCSVPAGAGPMWAGHTSPDGSDAVGLWGGRETAGSAEGNAET